MLYGYPRSLFVGVGYFAIASLTIAFTRYGGGFATLWFATSFLTAALATTPRKQWLSTLIFCGIGSAAATGILGLGWHSSLPLAAVNLIEGAVAAHLIRKRVAATMLDSLAWFGLFTLKVGLIAPAIGATLGSLAMSAIDHSSVIQGWVTWYVGHALGSLTFTPIALLLFKGEIIRPSEERGSAEWREATCLYLLFLATTIFTFAQSKWPILFLPLGPLTLICFRHDRALPALAIATLAIVGGLFTVAQSGPIALASGDSQSRIQFFQFYLACIVLTILPVTADLRNRRQLVKALRDSEAKLRVMIENSSDVVLHLAPSGRILFASPSIEELTGRASETLIGANALSLVDEEWQVYVEDRHFEVLRSPGQNIRYEYMAPIANGAPRWFETISRAVVNENGAIESVISMIRDIDARKHEEYGLVLEISRDALTGLSNRRAFERTFALIQDCGPHAVAMIDIDHFKAINDKYGHAGGDCALQTFAEVARRIVRKDDLVCRIGGEEFAILFKGIGAEQASAICDRLRRELAGAVTFHGAHAIKFTVSIGLADVKSPDLDYVLNIADEALYRAKRAGRDQLQLAA